MDLAIILRRGEVLPELTPPRGALSEVPTATPDDITRIERMGDILVAGVMKTLEVIFPLYGVETGIRTEDLLGFLKILGKLLQTLGRIIVGIGLATTPATPEIEAEIKVGVFQMKKHIKRLRKLITRR